MPKSSSFGAPSSVTRMLLGFRSRCTTRLRWAYWTAAQTARNSSRRSETGSRRADACSVIGRPLTYSITRYGWPSGVLPASMKRAMAGCSSRARIVRSVRNCSSESPTAKRPISLTATCCGTSPSRRARYTTPMPPRPTASSSR